MAYLVNSVRSFLVVHKGQYYVLCCFINDLPALVNSQMQPQYYADDVLFTDNFAEEP